MREIKKILITATVQSHICQFHRPLVKMLKQEGCIIHAAAKDNLAEKNGMKLDFVDSVFNVCFARSPFRLSNIKAYKQLRNILKDNKYDVIHCNTPVGGIITRLAARKYRKSGTRVFYTAHGFHFYEGASKLNWIIYYPIEKLMAKLTDKLITINGDDYELAKRRLGTSVFRIHGVGVNSGKYTVYSDDRKQILKKQLGFSHETKIILCVGELLKNKNQAMVLRAFKKTLNTYPGCKLVIAGNGPEGTTLKSVAQELGIQEKVVFLGYCLTLEDYTNICDISVSCSYREGLPLNLLESMLCKNPIVASKNRGHNELVADGKTGYLVAPDDSDTMADRINQLLSDESLRNEMGNAGFEKAKNYMDSEVSHELKGIYFT